MNNKKYFNNYMKKINNIYSNECKFKHYLITNNSLI